MKKETLGIALQPFFALLLPFAFLFSLLIVFMTIFFFWDALRKRKIEGKLPDIFPIVVTTPGRAQIVFKADLARFIEMNPDYSFLIPADKMEEYQAQIQSNIRATQTPVNFDQDSPIPWEAAFTAQPLSEGKLSFRVFATYDDDRENVGWYEATDKEIFPKYHKFYFGPGLVLMIGPISIAITILSRVLGIFVMRRLRNRTLVQSPHWVEA